MEAYAARRPGDKDRGRLATPATVALAAVLAVVVAGIVGDLLIALRPAAEVAAAPPGQQEQGIAEVAILVLFGLGMTLPLMGLAAVVRRATVPAAVVRLLAGLNAAAVALVLARSLTYDLYGGGATRYIADGITPVCLAVLAVLGVVVSLVVYDSPRPGLIANGLFLWTCSVVAFFAGFQFH